MMHHTCMDFNARATQGSSKMREKVRWLIRLFKNYFACTESFSHVFIKSELLWISHYARSPEAIVSSPQCIISGPFQHIQPKSSLKKLTDPLTAQHLWGIMCWYSDPLFFFTHSIYNWCAINVSDLSSGEDLALMGFRCGLGEQM